MKPKYFSDQNNEKYVSHIDIIYVKQYFIIENISVVRICYIYSEQEIQFE